MAIHQTSLYVGVIASGLVAGWIGDHHGWRSAFWIFGAFGLVLAGLTRVPQLEPGVKIVSEERRFFRQAVYEGS
jgi:MFS family permease